MQRQRGELVPIGDALADLGGPVPAIRETPPPARRGFTLADQVNQLVSASEADADLGFMARTMALCSLPRSNPGNRKEYKRDCDHLSVRLKHRPTRPLILGVVQTRASWTGLGVGALVAVALAMSLTNIWVAVSVALLVGWFGQLVGVAVIRGWRGLTRAIG